ncbi:type II CAAX prenyl endopeptidase Rce1 family protein [Granulicella cerasi]|uniref:Type II CAAX prenyl endopeptidase Rce1 family protein n=1 Tax=Granulicella cerasi TaxID=741063 RepID=A0ABW1ZDX2_9BACT
MLLCSAVALGVAHAGAPGEAIKHPLILGAAQAISYLLALAISFFIFPLLWERSFPDGIHWNTRPAKLHWWKLLLLGITLSVLAQLAINHLTGPTSESDVVGLFKTQLSSWLTLIIGGTLPALMEEIAFRGFLLPSLATAYDWLTLDRTPAGLRRWDTTANHTMTAWTFATLLSSLVFALLHAPQLHHAWESFQCSSSSRCSSALCASARTL